MVGGERTMACGRIIGGGGEFFVNGFMGLG